MRLFKEEDGTADLNLRQVSKMIWDQLWLDVWTSLDIFEQLKSGLQ